MLLLAAAVMFWLIGFDIIYALQDYEFDRRRGLHSLVVAWGPPNALAAAFLAHMIMWGLLFGFGLLSKPRPTSLEREPETPGRALVLNEATISRGVGFGNRICSSPR